MDCPKCLGKLQKTKINMYETSDIEELKGAVAAKSLEIDQCFVCGGVWFDKGELGKYTTEKITIIDAASVGKTLDKELDVKDGKCPKCSVVMKKTAYEKEPSITLDVCEKCGGIWLDSTEIDRVERANKGKIGFLGLFFKGFQRPKGK
ncbi:MAG: zf-TFIIB domain-containing protein [Candidatus Omnitrophota bacterium]